MENNSIEIDEPKSFPIMDQESFEKYQNFRHQINNIIKNSTLLLLFVIGTATTYLNILIPWFPTFLVIVYGGFVYYCYSKDMKLLSQKSDSIYFLGFLFTLSSLLVLGLNIPDQKDLLDYTPYALKTLTVAISTTIIGILLRFYLQDHAQTELTKVADQDYSSYLKRIAEVHVEFTKIHETAISLMNDFIINRKELLKEEEKITKKYVKSMTVLSDQSEELVEKKLPYMVQMLDQCSSEICKTFNRVSTANQNTFLDLNSLIQQHFTQIQGSINQFLDSYKVKIEQESIKQFELFNDKMTNTMSNLYSTSENAIKEYKRVYSDILESLLPNLKVFDDHLVAMKDLFKEIQSSGSGINRNIEEVPQLFLQFQESIQSLELHVKNLNAILDGYTESMGSKAKEVLSTF